ncbi:TMEM175 family protein [Kribbella qitaiheensis]|nr:TMEM175 family protein [Kribbella qitaiheensis]
MTRDPDRLVLFTDAVVAIAVTLLILPLVEAVQDVPKDSDPWTMIHEEKSAIFSFLLSFAVIARFWLVHHRVFEHVKAYNTVMIQLNMLWLLCIVVLPFPTEMIGHFDGDSRFIAGLYAANLLVLSACQTGLTLLVRGHRKLEVDDNPITDPEVAGSITFTASALIAFLLAALVPDVRFYALLVLILSGPAAQLILRLRKSPASAA